MPPFLDRTNKRYGRLIAIWPEGRNKYQQIVWLCACDCGELTHVQAPFPQSCGCLLRESAARNGRSTKGKKRPDAVGNTYAVRHGACRNGLTPEYVSYQAAKERCRNPNAANYAGYGGQGTEFRFTSFQEFFNEVGERPKPKRKYSIDRIDPFGHYEKGNVKWSTAKEQSANRRMNYV